MEVAHAQLMEVAHAQLMEVARGQLMEVACAQFMEGRAHARTPRMEGRHDASERVLRVVAVAAAAASGRTHRMASAGCRMVADT
jgi:hypothetical protein